MTRVAIIGGGPGGLICAYRLAQRSECAITVFEAADRLGGKLQTRRFRSAPVPYEAGAAECYDYRDVGPDPLHDLVDELGLPTRPMRGQTTFFAGARFANVAERTEALGGEAASHVQRFREAARDWLPLDRWHPGDFAFDASHPWTGRSCADLLGGLEDPVARRYMEIAIHSDLATDPHRTSGLNGLKNIAMELSGYVGYYAIEGGMARLAERLTSGLADADVRLKTRVTGLVPLERGRFRVQCAEEGSRETGTFDRVVLALPPVYLSGMVWGDLDLSRAMATHLQRFDHPGHYLRVSLLVDRPFWNDTLSGSWFMSDAFGGSCIYDESSRYDSGGHGVLGCLLAGNEALRVGNLSNEDAVTTVVEGLPQLLRDGVRSRLREARVHRWAGGVSANPGGVPPLDPARAHQPDALRSPRLYVVGDYLFDSTLNGVCRSAEWVAARIAEGLRTESAAPAVAVA